MMGYVQLNEVSKVFSSDAGVTTAISDLSLEVEKGQIVAVLGKTGCGKSTMFNLVAGLSRPSSGSVRVEGYDPFTDFDWFRGKLAIVFQNDRLMPWRTALENVCLGLELAGVPRKERHDTGRRWLTQLGLAGHEDDYPHALSGGMRQRVSIARAFCLSPHLLLCDEPFSALDAITAGRLREEFVELVRKEHLTSLFITHSLEEALTVGDRIVVFKKPAKVVLDLVVDHHSDAEVEQARQQIIDALGTI